MSIVASFVGGWGHAEPLLDVANFAVERGHAVTFAGQHGVLGRLDDLGFDTVVVGPDTSSADRVDLQPVDREMERVVMRDHFIAEFGSQRGPTMRELLSRMQPDALICDEVDVGAIVAAECLGIPTATVNVIAAGRLNSVDLIGGAWNRLRAVNGLAADPDGTRLGGDVMLAPFAASFRDPALPRPRHRRPYRPSTLAAATQPGSATDFVYATLGTVFNIESGDLLQRIATGLGLAGVDALLTVGPNIRSDDVSPPPRVDVEQFVAQHEVLSRCAAVVCHGGSGTLMAALSIGLPVVVIPMGADQPDNADRCADLGCGIVLDATRSQPDDIANAINRVLRDPSYKQQALRLAAEVAGQPALNEIAELDALIPTRVAKHGR